MFPYSDHSNDYYSGMFSSRPSFKKHILDGSNALHASSKLFALKAINQKAEINEALVANQELIDIMSVVQDHHAITGTAAQFVTEDYHYRLSKAMSKNDELY